jgi:hypothetical protein
MYPTCRRAPTPVCTISVTVTSSDQQWHPTTVAIVQPGQIKELEDLLALLEREIVERSGRFEAHRSRKLVLHFDKVSG